tara:strand:- start:5074 stop:5805 length:732 start_codon:yes stop_codon:yes gene_type:complete
MRLLYVQTPSANREAQLASDVLWNTDAGAAWRRERANAAWAALPAISRRAYGSKTQFFKALYATFSARDIINAARSVLGQDARQRFNIFDRKWSYFRNHLRTIFGWTEDYATESARQDQGDLATARTTVRSPLGGETSVVFQSALKDARKSRYDLALRRRQLDLERGNRTAEQERELQELNEQIANLSSQLTNVITVGSGEETEEGRQTTEEETKSDLKRNLAIGFGVLAGAGVASYFLFFRK